MARMSAALVVAALLFAEALAFAVLIRFASPGVVFLLAPLGGLAAAGACVWAGRARLKHPADDEPWRLDAWGALLAGLMLPALGWSAGLEAVASAWIFVVLLAGLGAMVAAGRA